MLICLDAETLMIEPGKGMPPPVGFGYGIWEDDGSFKQGGIVSRTGDHWWGTRIGEFPNRENMGLSFVALGLLDLVIKDGARLFNQNMAFDAQVLMGVNPQLCDRVLTAYETGNVECTMMRERIIDNAMGILDYWYWHETIPPFAVGGTGGNRKPAIRNIVAGKLCPKGYSLLELSRVRCGLELDKLTWRTGYSRYWDTPLDQWPEGARQYMFDDVVACKAVYDSQKATMVAAGRESGEVPTSGAQAQADLALNLQSTWGMRTDLAKVEQYKQRQEGLLQRIDKGLVWAGLLRADGSRDTKKMQEALAELERELGIMLPRTPTGRFSTDATAMDELADHLAGSVHLKTTEEAAAYADQLMSERSPEVRALRALAMEPEGDVRKALPLVGWHVTAQKMLSTYVPPMIEAARYPVGGRYDSFKRTGRTSHSAPNRQNLPKEPGIRECHVPRAGNVYCSVDYAGVELHTLAQTCLNWLNFSKLAEALNSGLDPHSMLAAEHLAKMDYDEFVAIRKSENHPRKDEIVKFRNMAKAANFGLPGGLGAESFVKYCRGDNLIITLEDAEKVKQSWLNQWPEMKEYFRYINGLMQPDWIHGYKPGIDEFDDDPDMVATVELVNGLIRGRARYTESCNFPFQGLAAVGGKDACWQLALASYRRGGSLFGSRPVLFVHDEIIMEHPEADASERAWEQTRIMLNAMRKLLPDVPPKAEPALMRCWYKKAEMVVAKGPDGQVLRDSKGNPQLLPWEPHA